MQTADRPPTGRERRRKDLYGRVRRFLYGLLLLAAAPGATAVDELAAYGKYRNAPSTAADVDAQPLATVQGLVVLRAPPERADQAPMLELETVTARIHGHAAEPAPHFLIAAVKAESGFDVSLADVGTLRLKLLLDGTENERTWSLGGTLALASEVDSARKIADVPAVRVHAMHQSETRYLPFEVSVRKEQIGFKWRA